MSRDIAVYADWDPLPAPRRLGWLHTQAAGGNEVFSFEFDAALVADPMWQSLSLDPRLALVTGRQYPAAGNVNFGLFLDSSPDRWGRRLLDRRLERAKRQGTVSTRHRLVESDYLLGVHDAYRVGGLRYRLGDQGDFLDNDATAAAPPWVRLRELEEAARLLEQERASVAEIDASLQLLVAPGGSLGGARPKASVLDPHGQLWIAKFPSAHDSVDIGAWELVVNALALRCGLTVPPARAQRFASAQHTFLVRRFDRSDAGRRLHYASAMTLTGRRDGDDADSGVSYLELAQVLVQHGAQPEVDLLELWSRIVFNMLVSNTDDHLRNHGFLLVPSQGWRLAPAFDMNPVATGRALRLNVSETDNECDLDLARSVAGLFRVKNPAAVVRIKQMKRIVAQWRTIATALRLSSSAQDAMASAFRLSAR